MTFEKELEHIINRYCLENESNTPDFILAQFIQKCLNAFNIASNAREKWYGIHNKPGQSQLLQTKDTEIKNSDFNPYDLNAVAKYRKLIP